MSAQAPSHVIVVTRSEPADQPCEQLRRIRDAVTDANVLLVAPALPVPGERWIVDLDARESQARARLQRWIGALAGHASAIEAQVGDADPGTAVTDARRELPAARVVDAPAAAREQTAGPGRLMRLAERYGLMPASVAAGR
jgi:hypothetical protein